MPRLTRFNDGVLAVYRERERKTDFSAKRNAATLDDLDFVAKLDYAEASRRQEDVEFAEQSGFRLSMKVRTRYLAPVRSKMKVVIDGYLYDIAYADKAGTEMFLYLEGVRELEVA